MGDDDPIVFVRKEGTDVYKTMKKSEAERRSDVHLRNKRDWVLGDDGVGHDTIVGEEYVEDK